MHDLVSDMIIGEVSQLAEQCQFTYYKDFNAENSTRRDISCIKYLPSWWGHLIWPRPRSKLIPTYGCVFIFIQFNSGDSKIFIGMEEEQSLFGLNCLCPDLLINLAGCEACD